MFDLCLDSIQRLHPDWDIRFYSREDLPDMHCQDIIDELLDKGQIAAAIAIIHLQLIVQHGGAAIDIDSYMLRDINTLTNSLKRGLIMRNFRHYGTHFMACMPKDPYFTRAIIAIPDVIGHIQRHCIPDDIFTLAKLFHWIETAESSKKINMRPSAFNALHLPEFTMLERYLVPRMKRGDNLPSYVRGIRMAPDSRKYHNGTYGKGLRTHLEHLEGHAEQIFRYFENEGIALK
jgi:hypothetical protein